MPGRRSISVEPESVASPRRSSRIKINHQDSPLPTNKTTDLEKKELPIKRTRRSSSIQEKSLNDIKDDLKKNENEKPKTPARRTRRSMSAQEEQKPPIIKEVSVKLRKTEIIEDKEEEDEEELTQEVDEQKTPPQDDEVNPSGRPKRRVTRSMSKSPVSLKNTKANVVAATSAAPATRSRRLSLNDKQNNDTKVLTLDIIAENEGEVEKETNETTDVLNNNKKQMEINEKLLNSEVNDVKESNEILENTSEKTEKNETETIAVPRDVTKETPEKSVTDEKNELNSSVKSVISSGPSHSPSPRRSPRVKAKDQSPVLNTSKQENNEEIELNVSVEKIETMEKKVNELIEKEIEETPNKVENILEDKQIQEKEVEKIQEDEEIQEKEIQNNKKVEEIQEDKEIQDKKEVEEIQEDKEIQNKKEVEKIQEDKEIQNKKEIQMKNEEKDEIVEDTDKLNESNISIVGSTSLNGSIIKEKKDNEEISKKLLEDDERPQNISLVNDDGRSYSPIIPKAETMSLRLNDSRKSLNSTCTSQKFDISLKDTSQTMEPLQMSMKDDDNEIIINESTKDISVNLDESKNSNKSTPLKHVNKSTPIRKTADDKENDDMNTSNNSSKKKNKRASINQLREQVLDDYIASFTAEKKRKRESLNSETEESSRKRRSGTKTISSCNFSEDEEDVSGGFLDDEASEGTEDTPSIGSNEIIDEGESIGSTNSEPDSDDTYDNDSFVVDDDEVEDEELLSGTEDFLGNMRMPKQRKRVMKMVSDSEEEEKDKLDNMSMEPYGGMSPTNMSEKQISSVDSDMESVKNRNEELSKQIEDGTLVPEVEAKRKMDEDGSEDDDIVIIEDNTKEQDETLELNESTKKESTKEEHTEESTKEEDNKDIEEEIVKDVQEQIETKEEDSINETKEEDSINETKNISEEDQNEEVKTKEDIPEEDKETKYKKLIEKYFDTNKNRSRRQTIGETVTKTPTKSPRKRKASLNFEIKPTNTIEDHETKETQIIEDHETKETQIIEVNLGLKQSDDESNTKYEFNNSGVYKVSPAKIPQQVEEQVEEKTVDESLLMLRDFNDSLNDSLDLITSAETQTVETKSTPIKQTTITETPTSSSKKKRKATQIEIVKTAKTETTEESDTITESEPETSKKKKRKMKQENKKTKQSECDLVSFQQNSSTDSEKENSMDLNKKRKKSKSPVEFNFQIQNCKVSPSKSEIEYDNYVPVKHRNIYKNLIKPSSSGFSGTSQFIIKDLVSKVSHGIKKQKYTNTKLNKNGITTMMNCPNWKETLFAADGIVKPSSNFRKNKKTH